MQVGQGPAETLDGGEVEGDSKGTMDILQDIRAEHKSEFFDKSQAEGQQLDACQTVMDMVGKGMKRAQD